MCVVSFGWPHYKYKITSYVDNNIYSRRMLGWSQLRQVYYLYTGDYLWHHWRNTKFDFWQMRRILEIVLVLLPILGMALFLLLQRDPSIVCSRCSMMTSTSSHKCTHCGYLIPYIEYGSKSCQKSSIDYVQLEEDREHFNATQTEWTWTAHYYIYMIPMNWRKLQEK